MKYLYTPPVAARHQVTFSMREHPELFTDQRRMPYESQLDDEVEAYLQSPESGAFEGGVQLNTGVATYGFHSEESALAFIARYVKVQVAA